MIYFAMIYLLSGGGYVPKKELEKVRFVANLLIIITISITLLLLSWLWYSVFVEAYKSGKLS